MSRVVIDSIPFTTYLHAAGHSNKGLLQRERARAQKFLAGKFHYVRSSIVEGLHGHHHKCTATAPSSTVPSGTEENITVGDPIDATDTGVIYTMSVGVGEPAVEYTLAIDTGSGHTWVGANLEKPYKPSECSHDTGHAIKLEYGEGSMFGEEYNDTLTLGPKLVIKNQGIGVAESTKGFKYFKDIDGVLGLGPVDLTQGDVVDTWEVPTVTDNLYSQHQIPRIIGVFYQPSSTANVSNGEITFGGFDETKCTGDLNFVQLTTVSPASQYWGINQSVSYGTDNIKLLDVAPGFVDTGCTWLLFATEAFKVYEAKTGGIYDKATKLLTITETQYENLQSLNFEIGGVTYELTRNAQIWPRKLNTLLEGGQEGKFYLIVMDLGTPTGAGLDFVNGFSWLQRFYTVYDTEKKQFGIATTASTYADTN